MQDVRPTSKTIASTRRLDTVIASPGFEMMDKQRLFSADIGGCGQCCSDLPVAYPTSGLRSHTFRPVALRRMPGTGRLRVPSGTLLVARSIHNPLPPQSLPA